MLEPRQNKIIFQFFSWYINKIIKSDFEEFKFSYGAIIDGLNSNTKAGRYWNPLNLIRWALTIAIMVYLNQHSGAQILVLLVVSVIFQIIILISNPMTDKQDQRIMWMIEISVSIYLYVLLSLTDFMGENTLRDELGWTLAIVTGGIVAINVLFFFWKTFWRVSAYVKRRFAKI
jgi:hypothetical protein